MTVLAVIGAQYGSEGKGVIVNHLAPKYNVHVRVGGPNAGHSFWHEGKVWKQQQLPCGWTNKNAYLIIGRGAVVDLELLAQEANAVPSGYLVYDRLIIDAGAFVLKSVHRRSEGGVEGEGHQRIGSTGEGVGEARIERLRRDPARYEEWGGSLVKQVAEDYGLHHNLHMDTPRLIRGMREMGEDVLLEGTQGVGLSLIHGPWPYVTSADTGAAQLAADAGVPPSHLRVLAVARTFPIRVAGNSGPLAHEITWEELGQAPEYTTVTKKLRRVGRWSDDDLWRTVTLNAPDFLALMFLDYLFPEVAGETDPQRWPPAATIYLHMMEQRFGVPIKYVGVGGPRFGVVER